MRRCAAWFLGGLAWLGASLAYAEDVDASRNAPRSTASLDVRPGVGLVGPRTFDVLTMVLTIDSYYIGLGFHKESNKRKKADDFKIMGLKIEGTREYETFYLPFSLGAELFHTKREYLDFRIDAHFKGGLELGFNKLKADGARIPGSPETDYLLGAGARAQITHSVSYWLGDNLYLLRNLYVGAGLEWDVLSRQAALEEVAEDSFVGTSVYLILGSTKTLGQ